MVSVLTLVATVGLALLGLSRGGWGWGLAAVLAALLLLVVAVVFRMAGEIEALTGHPDGSAVRNQLAVFYRAGWELQTAGRVRGSTPEWGAAVQHWRDDTAEWIEEHMGTAARLQFTQPAAAGRSAARTLVDPGTPWGRGFTSHAILKHHLPRLMRMIEAETT